MTTPIPTYSLINTPLHQSPNTTVQLISLKTPPPATDQILLLKTVTTQYPSQERVIHQRITEFQHHNPGKKLFPNLWYYEENLGEEKLVMDYCRVGNLAQWMENVGKEKNTAVMGRCIILQLTDALQTLHSLHISHGDIKPHNIFLISPTVPVLGDFGHARYLPSDASPSESEHSSSDWTFENDVFALGCTLLEFFIGRVGTEVNRMSEEEVGGIIEREMKEYPESFRSVLVGMMRRDETTRITAVHAFEIIASESESISQNSDRTYSRPSEELVRRSTVVMSTIIPIPLNNPSSSRSISDNSVPHLPPPIPNQVHFNFNLKTVGITTILEHETVDKELLKVKIAELVRWMMEHKGKVRVDLKSDTFICRGAINPHECFIVDLVTLGPCGCQICASCLNVHVLSQASQSNFQSEILCICEKTRIDPFEIENCVTRLEPNVIKMLDEIRLQSMVVCPKCDIITSEPKKAESKKITCRCTKEFCSFCLRDPHIFGCSELKRYLKEHR